jgi:hypothetical protein
MFRKSESEVQLNLFSSAGELMRGTAGNYYQREDSWHNLFRREVLMRIDEEIFKPLYCDNNGTPNASIRVLVGMMILKEGQGWSDEQLFEQCNYNLLIRSALGLMNLNDAVPVASTYYLFRRRIVAYNREKGIDLFKECQQKITRSQVLEFSVSGKQIRMDSKLIGSNIAWYSRYELVHETLRLFIEEQGEHIYKHSFSPEMFSLIKSIEGEKGEKVVYRSTRSEIEERFLALGRLAFVFLKLFAKYPDGQYSTLKSVFEQQYKLGKGKVVLAREKEEISSHSIQSPHDTDCHFREKNGKKVKGYSVNITESCDEEEEENSPRLNLITDVQVEVASTADNKFLKESILQTEEILDHPVEKVYADGAYNSVENQEFVSLNNKELILSGLQGAKARYELSVDSQNPDNLMVTDTHTGEIIKAQKVKTRKESSDKKWRIKTENGKYRYFNLENVRTSLLRQKLRDIPKEELNRRNNVEATIFQLGYHYSNAKTRYRGLAKHRLWAYSRTLWINFIRILKYMMQTGQRTLNTLQKATFLAKITFILQIIVKHQNNKKFNTSFQKNLIFSSF